MVGKDLIPHEVKDLVVSTTVSEGWISDYVSDLVDYVPYLSTSLSTVNGYFSDMMDYIPSKDKFWLVSKESAEQVEIIMKVPQWAIGSFSQTIHRIGCTYKTISGGFGALYSIEKMVKAIQCKDPICFSLSCAAVCLDLAKIGSNIFPYHHNCTKNDAINGILKGTTEVCERYKVCDKLKKVYSFVRGVKIKKLWGVFKR